MYYGNNPFLAVWLETIFLHQLRVTIQDEECRGGGSKEVGLICSSSALLFALILILVETRLMSTLICMRLSHNLRGGFGIFSPIYGDIAFKQNICSYHAKREILSKQHKINNTKRITYRVWARVVQRCRQDQQCEFD